MKTYSFFISCFLCACWFLSGCSKSSDTPTRNSPVKTISVAPEVASNVSNFAFNFFNVLQQTQPKTDNIFVSPLSLHMDLGMLLNGANGNTYTQLQNALNLNGLSISEINQAYQTLLQDLPNVDNQVQLTLANAMWYENSYSIKSGYVDTLKNYFQSPATAAPFDASTADAVNQWASEKTNGKINNVTSAKEVQDLVMLLVNALYFKGNWASQFDKNATQPQTFTMENGTTKQVQMMQQINTFVYSQKATYSAIRLPYGNGQFSMTILLPTQGNTIESVMNNFTAANWNAFQQDTLKQSVQVGLPRFTIPAYNVDLNTTLQSMGVTDAFSKSNADFSTISAIKLFVSLVKQFTYLNVDETGTEAAAVTVIGTQTTSAPIQPTFTCDHPFGFIISEKTSNTILFMGRIMNPDSQ